MRTSSSRRPRHTATSAVASYGSNELRQPTASWICRMRFSSARTAVVSFRALWTRINTPPRINSDGVFREMKPRGHYERPSESKTRDRQREKHEKSGAA
jgi:hypothetical protein